MNAVIKSVKRFFDTLKKVLIGIARNIPVSDDMVKNLPHYLLELSATKSLWKYAC